MLSIRTQGKRSLLPYSRIDIIDGFVEYSKNEGSKYFNDFDFEEGMLLVMDNKILGVYKTATRVLEVLDEIEYMTTRQGANFLDEMYVYQMPKE